MPLSQEDQQVFDHLQDAGKLYEQYVEISRMAELPVGVADIGSEELPPRTDIPLTVWIHSARR